MNEKAPKSRYLGELWAVNWQRWKGLGSYGQWRRPLEEIAGEEDDPVLDELIAPKCR